ncbi:hypothetical protein L873DRAFT_1816207 [Choiromyces venosus 120613-1]|uniref:Uncharacterized protein n=1 Tax=Choiromyces venosus 120613-1 TaxID=1336337 RepID=A0A3N4J512_9PEZI|nr:hypothetical protein L873DRAFT_1816207 [Choiromyces venosus 120613-1]
MIRFKQTNYHVTKNAKSDFSLDSTYATPPASEVPSTRRLVGNEMCLAGGLEGVAVRC